MIELLPLLALLLVISGLVVLLVETAANDSHSKTGIKIGVGMLGLAMIMAIFFVAYGSRLTDCTSWMLWTYVDCQRLAGLWR